MTFVSYAQNFEDVMLWRALKHVAQGFWIDVGAAHPDEYSVTRTFSDQGWRGINIEANPSYAPRIASARPRDVTLAVAAGAGSLPVHFFEVVGTGLSTTDHAIAEQHRAAGFEVREHEVPSRRLASICDEFAPHDIHFLKIDVEGAERDVLAGADFIRHRPWIVLVEATKPLSQEQTHAEWEDLLLAADYRFVWFDGLNRFYIAAERWEELAPAFVVPANVFDDFIRAADAEHLNRIIDAEMRARQAEARIGQAELRAAQAEARAREEEGRAGQAEARAAQAEAQAVQAEASAQQAEAQTRHAEARVKQAVAQAESHAAQEAARAAAAQERADEANVRLAQVYASTSWRTTGPMRAGRRLMQKRVGVALQEAGMPQSRVQRLKRVMGEGGGATKKAGRLAFYLVTRAASRLPGAGTVGQRLERIAPRPWGWLRQRGDAYLAAALQDEVPPPSPEPGRAMVRPAITYTGSTGRRTRIVHQFHSGSAPGDAVTNSLLLMRDWLRGQGYASEIFVQHRHPALEAELLEIDDLPAHDDYALVVHHSMGYDALDRILALPVQKVLMYHNITPSKFLQGLPVYIHYADLGRQQLGIMRPYMVAALADSEFNALELRSAGYDAPVACPFLFDVRRLLTEAAGQRSVSDLFTILFVGRVVPSKGQADLVDAFAAFRAAFGAACRLVLVGKAEADGAPYPTEIHQRIALHGLKDQVILTGAVSDDELHDWYRTADLYVSLSHHEGFGVPLVEAMAHGVPILAWPAGAVPYTLGGAGVLLPERSPEAVGRTMLELARDPDLRAHIASRQADVLEGFQLDRHAPKLM
ncbi:MAG TPA: FkbM family methyltransferase, partial [Roseomonas sp.]